MKKFVKILSLLVSVIMLMSVVTVGFTAYAEPSDVLGDYDFTVVDNPYSEVQWDNEDLHAFKSATHDHTVRSDADIELNDTIWYHYMCGYEVFCLTDHGTVNGVDITHNGVTTGATGVHGVSCGWTENQDRCALYFYQSFVHGNIDEITKTDYDNIIYGRAVFDRPADLVAAGRGMFNLPLGNECNAASTNKCHVNTYNVSFGHGANRSVEWPESTVAGSYNVGGYSHINHVGEWTDGNGDPSVYTESWVNDYVLIYERYCPNRSIDTENIKYHENITGQMVPAGVIGMELVNTADNRTRNDRYYVYDASLKKLAPQGINIYGFCEDDSHEESDIDRNAQYFLVNDGTAWSEEDKAFYGAQYPGEDEPWYGYTGDIVRSMTTGQFYCSSKNSKNSYELGDGFNAAGPYPSLNYFNVDDEKDQITLRVTNASKVRLVADGNIIATETVDIVDGYTTVTFDLNEQEDLINSYVRIYLTGAGGITYLQPILLSKTERKQSFVQFILPSTDTKLFVYDTKGTIDDTSDDVLINTDYTENVYVLEPGDYIYKATRDGYLDTVENFTVTQEDWDSNRERIIEVVLNQDENVNFAYFYAPETIYVDPTNGQDFQYYVDRANEIDGALNTSANKTTGNLFFYRKGATDIDITYSYQDGITTITSLTTNPATLTAASECFSGQIINGRLADALADEEYLLVKWTATYKHGGTDCVSTAYSYVYRTPSPINHTLSAGGGARTNKNISWLRDDMYVIASVFVYGVHSIASTDTNGYEYAPYYNDNVVVDGSPYVSGRYYKWAGVNESSGGSASNSPTGGIGTINADISRINNFSQVPYFTIGFDVNQTEECTGVEPNGRESYTTFSFGGTTFHSMRNLSNLDQYSGKRICRFDNAVSGSEVNYQFAEGDSVQYAVTGTAQGVKRDRNDTVNATVYVVVNKVDKSELRKKVNDSIKQSYQEDWFTSVEEFNEYQNAIIEAAKILGDPCATKTEIETGKSNLENIEENIQLNTGTATVKHYYEYKDPVTQEVSGGLIRTEDTYTYTFNDSLVANSTLIDGYAYAHKYERYINGELVETGNASYEVITAAEASYEWRFYYNPEAYDIIYNTGVESFVPNGGTGLHASYAQQYTIATNSPSRTGYTFGGWYLDIDPTYSVYSSGQTIMYDYMEPGQFNARWIPLSYNVSFDLNGGAFKAGEEPTAEDKVVTFDEVYQIPMGVPERTGYRFVGWEINGEVHAAGSQFQWTFPNDGVLVAQWENAEYTVTFDPVEDDATVDPTSKTVAYDKPYGTLPTPERTGYTHQWYSDPNCYDSSLVVGTKVVKTASDHTLYADWTPVTYSISYDLAGGVEAGVNPTSYTIESSPITVINPVRTGYQFLGWSGTDLDVSSYHTEVTIDTGSYGDREYVAHWEAVDYTITYNLNDSGSVSSADNSMNPTGFTYADEISIVAPTRTGYNFLGWTGEDYTQVQNINIPAGTYAKNLEFTANWSIITYSIEYDVGNGQLAAGSPTSYTVETESFTIPDPTWGIGYTFYGWESESLSEITANLEIPQGSHGDLKLTAVWLAGTNAILYELNGGAVTTTTNPTEYESGQTITLANPEKTGYDFAGWIKTDVTTGVSEPATLTGQILSDDQGPKKFTATWTAKEYSIVCDLDGGHYEYRTDYTVDSTDRDIYRIAYTTDSTTFTLINPIKEGYKFAGWKTLESSIAEKTVTIEKGTTGDKTYIADWEIVSYVVNYDLNGGTSTASCITSYNINTEATIGSPARLGYVFDGWIQHYQNFTWKNGTINTDGYLENTTEAFISSPILIRSGYTYTFETAATSGVESIKMHFFGADLRKYQGSRVVSTDGFALSQTGARTFIYLEATGDHLQAAVRDTIKIHVTPTGASDKQPTIEIPQGSTGNFHLKANWVLEEYSITYDLDGGYYPQYDENGVQLPVDYTYNPNPTQYNTETETFTVSNPVKEGYSFIGWNDGTSTASSLTIEQGTTGNLNYTAVWNETLYTITYNLNGGVVSNNPINYRYSTPAFTLNNPTRTGYTFSGWIGTDIDGVSMEVTVEQNSTGNREYTATWTPDTYNIVYILNGGVNSDENPATYTVATETFTLAQPTKAGASFAGWTDETSSVPVLNVTIDKGSTGDKTFTANWNMSTFTLSYNLAGGTDPGNPQTYSVDSDPITLLKPTKAGYSFVGWTGTGLSAVTEYVTIETGSLGNRSYTANWSPIEYNINYTLGNNAQVGIANPTSYTIETNTFTLNNPVRPGYNFMGWTGTGISSMTTTVTVNKGSYGNRSYTANWDIDEFTITYVNVPASENEALGNPTTYTVTSPDITLNTPKRTGYDFAGWSGTGIAGTGTSLTVVIKSGSTGHRTYTANWTLTSYNIEYELNGGTPTIANPTTYNYLSSPITLHNPTKAGYTFLGWTTGEEGETPELTVTIPTNSTGDKYFVANWDEGIYTITWNLDGGSAPDGYTYPVEYKYDTETMYIQNPEKAGYSFAGWTGTDISGTKTELVISVGSVGNREYTAHWAEGENIITYDLAGGKITGDENPTSYVTNSGTIILTNPIRSGYRFAGWTGTGISTPTVDVEIDTSAGGALAFLANWTPVTYKISYVLSGGALPSGSSNPSTYTVKSSNITLVNPTRTGYTFKGWSGTGLDGTQPNVTIISGSVGARTYTAVWEETVYTITYNYGEGSVDVANPTEYTYTSETITLNNPTLIGYTFTGWTEGDSTEQTLAATIKKGSTGNKTFTAHYSINTYTIRYSNTEDSVFTAPATTYTVKDTIVLPNPTKAGYVFEGWQGTGILGVQRDVVIPEGSAGNRSYTAVWAPINYTITYDLAGGRVSGVNPTAYTVESADFSILNPGRAGYGFSGWSLSIVDFIWSEGPVINSDGSYSTTETGFYSMPVSLKTGVTYYFDAAVTLVVPNADGTYTFVTGGSYAPTEDCICTLLVTSKSVDLTKIEIIVGGTVSNISVSRGNMGSLKLVANWTTADFTITYYLAGGTLAEGATNPASYNAESDPFTLNNPTKTGYTFLGWTGTGLDSATQDVTVATGSTGNRVYTANWKVDKYYLNINLDGGKFTESVPEYYTIATATFTLPVPVKSGYTFAGWLCEDGSVVTSVTIYNGSTGTRSYTAQWTENTSATHWFYFYGFNDQLIAKQEVAIGEKPAQVLSEEVIGYKFNGWSVNLNSSEILNSADDIHVYSNYVIGDMKYTITINGVTAEYSQYAKVKAEVASTSSDGKAFSYWINTQTNEIVSYYPSFTFSAHTDMSIEAVYGVTVPDRVAIRITKAEYNSEQKLISFYSERSIASEYTVLQHGIIFTDDETIANDADSFVLGTTGVYASTASKKTRSGVYTLSIGGLEYEGNDAYTDGEYLYARAYVKYSDADGNVKVAYSDCSSYTVGVNKCHNDAKFGAVNS